MSSTIRATTFVLAVHDLQESTDYYVNVLGFRRHPIDAPGWSFLSRGLWHLRIGECPDAIPPGELGDHSFYAYIDVSDATAMFEEVRKAGAEIIAPLDDKPWGMREFALRTVDGHRIVFGEDIERTE